MSPVNPQAKTGHMSARAIVIAAAAITVLLFGVWRNTCTARPASPVRVAWQIDIKDPYGGVLQDVSRRGLMLVESRGPGGKGSWLPVLDIWPEGRDVPSAQILLSSWPKYEKELPAGLRGSGSCKFIGAGDQIVCAQGPWLNLIDVSAKTEIRRIAGTKDLAGLDWDATLGAIEFLETPDFSTVLAVSPTKGRIAVAYNTLKNPKILLYSHDLRTTLDSWQARNYIEGLFWSRDGRRLGVLYWNPYLPFNRKGKFTGWHPGVALSGVHDVSIFNVDSGKELLSFATKYVETKAAFSPDGKAIYVIAHTLMNVGYERKSDWERETLREFSATTGNLIRTFKVSRTGVRNNFAVSPDGRFIAAECNKDTHSDWYYMLRLRENLGNDIRAGFVMLDSSSGRVVFRKTIRMGGSVADSLPLFFSHEDGLLIANFGQTSKVITGHLIGYSIAR